MEFQSRAEKQRKRRLEHKKNGLCIQCSAIALPNRSNCEKHRKLATQYSKKTYLRRCKEGRCGLCSEKAVLGKKACKKHLELSNQYSKKHYLERKKRWLKEGRCTRCGWKLHPEFDEGNVTCNFCIEKRNKSYP